MYFSASSDEAAAATIEDGPEPASAPGFDAVALGGIEPVVQMGALEGLLTGVDHDDCVGEVAGLAGVEGWQPGKRTGVPRVRDIVSARRPTRTGGRSPPHPCPSCARRHGSAGRGSADGMR